MALVGDTAYSVSHAAGMGGALAIVGAIALADSFQKPLEVLSRRFKSTTTGCAHLSRASRRMSIFGLEMFVPRTKEALQRRNAHFNVD
jgi:2-polyprenyl-6-methoxyphenol hydroxylase-like FAD-dependent oxidoreductase